MGTHAAFPFDVTAALVLWGWKILVSIPAASITVLIQRDRVSMFAQVNVRSFCGDQYPIDTFCAACH